MTSSSDWPCRRNENSGCDGVTVNHCLGVPLLLIALAPAAFGVDFSLGVSAGDVTDTSVMLWTRADLPGQLRAELALDRGDDPFADIAQSAAVAATADNDRTVKLEMSGLSPASDYVYRFIRADDETAVSPVGRFRTAPSSDQPAAMRFVFSGDTNFRSAPFGVMSHAAREDADLFIWYGDTIYADVPAGGLGTARTLEEYRAKYAQTLGDPNVQSLLARMAVMVGWDDHEVRNDYAGTDPDLSREQRDAAYRAFFEYLPIRDQAAQDDPFRTYRRFRYGANVEFFVLDGRQYRDVPADDACNHNVDPTGFILGPLTHDPDCLEILGRPRTMLGDAQRAWLMNGLLESAAPVKFIVNAVPLSFVGVLPYDRWDGYDAERRALLEFIDENEINGVVFLTTDIHANAYNPDVMTAFRNYRPDYVLDNGTPVAEIIVGPLGNATARESIVGFGGGNPLLFGLLDFAERGFSDRLRSVNQLAFLDTNRVAYAVIDVSQSGEVSVTYRGAAPEDANDPNAAIETMFSARLAPDSSAPPPLPCGLPILLVLSAACLVSRPRRST